MTWPKSIENGNKTSKNENKNTNKIQYGCKEKEEGFIEQRKE